MDKNKHQQAWIAWRDQELDNIKPILKRLHFNLAAKQVHIRGERYLASGRKLVLLGTDQENKEIVIKISKEPAEIKHIWQERKRRQVLSQIDFAYYKLFSPAEVYFGQEGGFTILATEFIPQKYNFLDRSLEKQFFLALKGFAALSGVHATTSKHSRLIRQVFGEMNTGSYLENFKNYKSIILKTADSALARETLSKAEIIFKNQSRYIDLYTDFLTHWDFVPHNIRIRRQKIYLLDHSAIRFGNKHEGMARFINFMALYHPRLAQAMLDFIYQNHAEEESISLKLMRLFRSADLLHYYSSSLHKTDAQLYKLNRTRINFWLQIMTDILYDRRTDPGLIEEFKKTRDSLRSPEEKERQKNLH